MKTRHLSTPSYMHCYRAHIGAIGRRGQRRLQRASVVLVGAGGVGTAMAMALAGAGVGKLVLVDPQDFSVDNLNRAVFSRPRDVGRPKVDVFAAFMLGRPHLTVVPVRAGAEALHDVHDARTADVVVAASNTTSSRLAVSRFAYERHLAQVSAAVTDGRRSWGGLILEWTPRDASAACPACFLRTGATLPRGESLFAPVVSVVAALAAWRTIRLLLDRQSPRHSNAANCTAINLDSFECESFRVLRRTDCSACSRRSRGPQPVDGRG